MYKLTKYRLLPISITLAVTEIINILCIASFSFLYIFLIHPWFFYIHLHMCKWTDISHQKLVHFTIQSSHAYCLQIITVRDVCRWWTSWCFIHAIRNDTFRFSLLWQHFSPFGNTARITPVTEKWTNIWHNKTYFNSDYGRKICHRQ